MKDINQLWKRGADFLGVEKSIMGGAMSWVSESNLVAAVSNNGGFGVIASGSMDGPLLKAEIKKTKEKTNKNFGVNLITLNPKIDELISVCKEEKISHVVLAGGLPSSNMISSLKENSDIKVLGFSPSLAVARRMINNGVDAIIIEGSEAGGHIGPISTSVLLQEILLHIKDDIPVFVAGGIGRGEAAAAYIEMGASGVQVGTLLVCSDECIAHEKFKKAFIRANSKDAQVTVQIDRDFPVIPVRSLVNKGYNEFMEIQQKSIDDYKQGRLSKEEAQLEIEKYWVGALRRAVIDGDVETGSLMAGQSVGLVKEIKPVKAILDDLVEQANNYLNNK